MEQYIIIQTVGGNGIVDIVVLIGVPVLRQLLGAEYQYRFVAILIVFHDSQRRKGFAQSHTVRKDTSVVFFKLIDDGQDSIPLKVVEHAPDLTLLKAGRLIGKLIL